MDALVPAYSYYSQGFMARSVSYLYKILFITIYILVKRVYYFENSILF